jgi:hypothetical protein
MAVRYFLSKGGLGVQFVLVIWAGYLHSGIFFALVGFLVLAVIAVPKPLACKFVSIGGRPIANEFLRSATAF